MIEHRAGNSTKIIQKGKGINANETFFSGKKPWDHLEKHSKVHHQYTMVGEKENVINYHGSKGHTAACHG